MPDSIPVRGPFGSIQELANPAAPNPEFPAGTVRPDGERVLVTDIQMAQHPGFAQARAARAAEEARPEATLLESAGAAVNSWDTTRLIKRLGRPAFDNDTPIDQFQYLEHIPLSLDKDEREYFMDTAHGEKSAAYAIEQIEDRRRATGALGDHPVVGLVTSFADPLWLAVPPAIRIGKVSPVAGRMASAAAAGAFAAGVTAVGEGPVSDDEIAMSLMLNSVAGAALYHEGKGFVKNVDHDLPEKHVDDTIKGMQETVDANKPVLASAEQIVQTVDDHLAKSSESRGLGQKLMWNMHKTMSGFGEVGRKVANLIYDNNADLGLNSVESHREVILSDLRTHQYEFEGLLRKAMSEDGFGTLKMLNPFTSREAYAAQAKIEREVQRELFRREQFERNGLPITTEGVSPRIMEMADKLDLLHKQALREMKAAGVEGAENLLERAGYLNRKWNSVKIMDVIEKLKAMGMTHDQAHAKVKGLVALSLRTANGMDNAVSHQIGGAIIDRALRKGYFEDAIFNTPAGAGQMKELRDILSESHMSPADIERAMDVIRVASDEAGKQSYLKHRMDLDYRATMRIGNEDVSIMDLIDGRVTTIVDQYIQKVATNSAMARKGLRKNSDIEALREELLHSVPAESRSQARDLFDNTMAHMRGDPAGAKVSANFQLLQAYGRSVSLAWSGLWQATEYANAMGEYGLLKTLKYAAQEIPGFREIMRPDKETARTLNNVLAEHSMGSMRLRPFLARFEDGFEMDMTNALQLSAQTANQLVPTANAMRYVHHNQAKVVGNLIMDRMQKAADGHVAAREALAKYGLEYPVMDKLAAEIKKHGFEVDQWDDAVWAAARPAFGKMMDAAVLKSRLGDVPAFAAFDRAGKFIFTYRTFVLAAHNKVLAGGLERNGAGAVGLVLLYQFPLTLAAVQAQASIKGQGQLSQKDLIKQSLGQMGGLGLFSEPLKWATGQSNSVGAPALIPVDRAVKLFQAGVNHDPKQAASTALTMMPVISAVPFIRGMADQVKK